jgi:hypothetical protein
LSYLFPLLHPLFLLSFRGRISRILNSLQLSFVESGEILLARIRVELDLLSLFKLSPLKNRRHIASLKVYECSN